MIIGVCGFIGSGKDTVADYLVAHYDFKRESFAGTLKDAVSQVFGWDRELLEGKTTEGRDWREQRDQWWSERLGMEISPRWVLQTWGTEVCRQSFHDDIWVASLENKLRKTNQNIVISDCRFPNEIKAIRAAGGVVVRVMRGEEPVWLPLAKLAAEGDESAIKALYLNEIHKSEWAWTATDFDHTITNENSLAELYASVSTFVTNL